MDRRTDPVRRVRAASGPGRRAAAGLLREVAGRIREAAAQRTRPVTPGVRRAAAPDGPEVPGRDGR
ncbi:hypothetical protein [Micromonospora sp. NPDC003816]|uniref:hypothetical protein n=1 Tax=Micromonospora sp. NPDC003816 TaxID=3364224 RepID=UPI00368F3C27